jgi:hypothetical protein
VASTALHHYFRTKICLSATRLTWLRQQALMLKVCVYVCVLLLLVW